MIAYVMGSIYDTFHAGNAYNVHMEGFRDIDEKTGQIGTIALGVFVSETCEPLFNCTLGVYGSINGNGMHCEITEVNLSKSLLVPNFVTLMSEVRNATAGSLKGKTSTMLTEFTASLKGVACSLSQLTISDVDFDDELGAYVPRDGGPVMVASVTCYDTGTKTIRVDFNSIETNKFKISTNTGVEIFNRMLESLDNLSTNQKLSLYHEYEKKDEEVNNAIFAVLLAYFAKNILPKYTRIRM